jgi:hypothetical protein
MITGKFIRKALLLPTVFTAVAQICKKFYKEYLNDVV